MLTEEMATQIHALAAEGQNVVQIAGTVGVEIGDVETVLAGAGFFAEEAGGGTSEIGDNVIVHRYTFDASHDEAALAAGVATLTPSPFDVLLNAWIDVNEVAWDGTTPTADVAPQAFWTGQSEGIFSHWGGGAIDLTVPRTNLGGLVQSSSMPLSEPVSTDVLGQRRLPALFLSGDPLLVVVSQDGTQNGEVPGASVGAFSLYLVTATPLDLSFGHKIK